MAKDRFETGLRLVEQTFVEETDRFSEEGDGFTCDPLQRLAEMTTSLSNLREQLLVVRRDHVIDGDDPMEICEDQLSQDTVGVRPLLERKLFVRNELFEELVRLPVPIQLY